MKKVAILGGGYLSQALLDLYLCTPHSITVIDNKFNPHLMTRGWFNFIKCDLIKHIPDLSKFDIVINLCGIASSNSTDEKTVMKINRDVAIEAAKMSKHYVFASTNNVFGGMESQGYDLKEDSPIYPKGVYAKSKADVEKWLTENCKSWVALRFGSVFGYSHGMNYAPVGNAFILNALFNKPLMIHGDGKNIRPMCHVKDIARVIYHAAHNEIPIGIYHCASRVKSLKDLAEEIKELHPQTEIQYNLDKTDTFVGYHINTDKIKATGFEFKYELKDAFKEMKRLFTNAKYI